jgi:hypothetical protein
LQGIHQVIEEVKTKVETNVTDKEKEMLKVSFRGALKSQIASLGKRSLLAAGPKSSNASSLFPSQDIINQIANKISKLSLSAEQEFIESQQLVTVTPDAPVQIIPDNKQAELKIKKEKERVHQRRLLLTKNNYL